MPGKRARANAKEVNLRAREERALRSEAGCHFSLDDLGPSTTCQ